MLTPQQVVNELRQYGPQDRHGLQLLDDEFYVPVLGNESYQILGGVMPTGKYRHNKYCSATLLDDDHNQLVVLTSANVIIYSRAGERYTKEEISREENHN